MKNFYAQNRHEHEYGLGHTNIVINQTQESFKKMWKVQIGMEEYISYRLIPYMACILYGWTVPLMFKKKDQVNTCKLTQQKPGV
jgi:hypothetical protein